MKTPFTPDEHASIVARLRTYSPAVDPIGVEFWWVDFKFESTLGQFKPKKSIYLSGKDKSAILQDGTADSIILHELEHCASYRRQGWLLYALGNLSKVNEWSAYAKQTGADAEWEMRNKLEQVEKNHKV